MTFRRSPGRLKRLGTSATPASAASVPRGVALRQTTCRECDRLPTGAVARSSRTREERADQAKLHLAATPSPAVNHLKSRGFTVVQPAAAFAQPPGRNLSHIGPHRAAATQEAPDDVLHAPSRRRRRGDPRAVGARGRRAEERRGRSAPGRRRRSRRRPRRSRRSRAKRRTSRRSRSAQPSSSPRPADSTGPTARSPASASPSQVSARCSSRTVKAPRGSGEVRPAPAALTATAASARRGGTRDPTTAAR